MNLEIRKCLFVATRISFFMINSLNGHPFFRVFEIARGDHWTPRGLPQIQTFLKTARAGARRFGLPKSARAGPHAGPRGLRAPARRAFSSFTGTRPHPHAGPRGRAGRTRANPGQN